MSIDEHIRSLELELLTSATRKNAERVSTLLADDFREFGSSGRVYSKKDIISALQLESPVIISAVDVEISWLAEHVALVTYKSVKNVQTAQSDSALRSSIWTKNGERWNMVFHQGMKLS